MYYTKNFDTKYIKYNYTFFSEVFQVLLIINYYPHGRFYIYKTFGALI